ncbi:MAG: DUF2179 domain-containing protein [Bacteroidales bacterium]|nr:DUF2179 domain-containing protein [Bacteroidales bacterium]MCF8403176.1 DUF2179 domain-containing protein [Bacteroidales bacterium]
MLDSSLFSSEIFAWVILPLLIFFARIMDVSIGTLRLIFVSKGFKYLAPILGFFEVIIWLLAISQIIQHLDSWIGYVAYGLGFATGNYIGIILDEKLSIGNVIVRVIPKYDTTQLISDLRKNNFAVTSVEGKGMHGEVNVILSIISRKDIKEYIHIVNQFNPKAFYTIEDVNSVKEGYIRLRRPKSVFNITQKMRRRGK